MLSTIYIIILILTRFFHLYIMIEYEYFLICGSTSKLYKTLPDDDLPGGSPMKGHTGPYFLYKGYKDCQRKYKQEDFHSIK